MLSMPAWHLILFVSLIAAFREELTSSAIPSSNQIIQPPFLHPYKNPPIIHNISTNSNRLQARGDRPPDPRKHLRGGALRTYNDKSQSSSRSPSPSSSDKRTSSQSPPPRPSRRSSSAARPVRNLVNSSLDIPSQQIPRGRQTGPSQHSNVPPLIPNAIRTQPRTNSPNPHPMQHEVIPAHYPGERISEEHLRELFPYRNSRPLDLSIFRPDHPLNRPVPPQPRLYHNPWHDPSQRISPGRLRELFPPHDSRQLDLSIFRPQQAANQLNHRQGQGQGHNVGLDRLAVESPVADRDSARASNTDVSMTSGTGNVRSSSTSPGAQSRPSEPRQVMGPPLQNSQKIRIVSPLEQGPRTTQHQKPIQPSNSLRRLDSWELPTAVPSREAAHSPNPFLDPNLLQQPVVTLPTSGRAQRSSPILHQNPVQQTTPLQNFNSRQHPTTAQFRGLYNDPSPFQNLAQHSSPSLNRESLQQPGALLHKSGHDINPFQRASSFSNSSPSQIPSPTQHQTPIQSMNSLFGLQRLPTLGAAQRPRPSNWFRTGLGSPEGTDRGYTTLSVAEMAEEAQRLTLDPSSSFPQARRISLPPTSDAQSQVQRISRDPSQSSPSAQQAPLSPFQSQAGSYGQAEGQPQSPRVRLTMDTPREATQKEITPKRQKKDGK